jgi:hypothetical protein
MKIGADDFIQGGATADDLDGLPRVETWPQLSPDALYGLPGRIVRTVDPYTEAAEVGTLMHFLAAVGNVIGATPHAKVGYDEHPLRLNVAIVGATAKGRKGTSWSAPRHLLRQVDQEWAENRINGGVSSGEGLIYHVRDPLYEEKEVVDKAHPEQPPTKKRELKDAGVEDKRLLVIESELANVLKVMGREGNTLSGVIRQAWDSGRLSTLTKNSPVHATDAHISIIGHITVDEVRRHLSDTERANGFANRFLWCLVRRSKLLPEGESVPPDELEPLIAELRSAVSFARGVVEVARDEISRAIWRDLYPELSEGEVGLVGGIISRAEAQVLRLSALYAVLDHSSFIREPHLKAALAVWDYAEESARRIFGGLLGDRTADIILGALRKHGSLSETQLHNLFGRNKPRTEIKAALEQLRAKGKIHHRFISTGGRPTSCWYLS